MVCLIDERVEEMVQCIFADSLELVSMLVMARLGAVVDMTLARRPAAGNSFRLALCAAAVTKSRGRTNTCEAIRGTLAGCYAMR